MMNWLTRAKPKAQTEQRQFKQWQIQWIRKPKARSLILRLIKPGELRVTSPKSLAWKYVSEFIESRQDWIRVNEAKYRQNQELNPPHKLLASEKYLFLGQELKLRYLPTPLRTVFFSKTDLELRMHLPETLFENLQEDDLQKYFPNLKKFYRREAVQFLSERIKVWSQTLGLEYQRLSFRTQKSRWGSCSSAGNISLNLKLITAPLFVIDSVLIHELCHLRHMNHSSNFWALVEKHDPHHKQADKWLRANHPGMSFLD